MVPEHPRHKPSTLNIQPQLHRGVRHHQVAQNAKNTIQNEFFCVFGDFFKFRFLHDCLIRVETLFPTIWKGGSEAAGDGSFGINVLDSSGFKVMEFGYILLSRLWYCRCDANEEGAGNGPDSILVSTQTVPTLNGQSFHVPPVVVTSVKARGGGKGTGSRPFAASAPLAYSKKPSCGVFRSLRCRKSGLLIVGYSLFENTRTCGSARLPPRWRDVVSSVHGGSEARLRPCRKD
jgi:hypothetical protein